MRSASATSAASPSNTSAPQNAPRAGPTTSASAIGGPACRNRRAATAAHTSPAGRTPTARTVVVFSAASPGDSGSTAYSRTHLSSHTSGSFNHGAVGMYFSPKSCALARTSASSMVRIFWSSMITWPLHNTVCADRPVPL